MKKKIPISFEVFPPDTARKFSQLERTCLKLNELQPEFFSVTFGAAGSVQLKTVVAVEQLVNNSLSAVPHISCVGMSSTRLLDLLERYKLLGINKLVVVRGDLSEESSTDFPFAADLVAAIRKHTGDFFNIIVAAYPEFHPQARSSKEDLAYFKRKVDEGANSAITQFFFNCEAYLNFIESCAKMGIKIPIIPGILPIYNYNNLLRFATKCGAEVPLWLRKKLEVFAHDDKSLELLGLEVVTKLCQYLTQNGAEKFHFYTLNRYNIVWKIYQGLY